MSFAFLGTALFWFGVGAIIAIGYLAIVYFIPLTIWGIRYLAREFMAGVREGQKAAEAKKANRS